VQPYLQSPCVRDVVLILIVDNPVTCPCVLLGNKDCFIFIYSLFNNALTIMGTPTKAEWEGYNAHAFYALSEHYSSLTDVIYVGIRPPCNAGKWNDFFGIQRTKDFPSPRLPSSENFY
jgi:hypothetical protein